MVWLALSWMVTFRIVFAETILCLRTWAMWNTNKVVGIVLASAMLAYIIAQCILGVQHNRSLQFAPPPYSGFRGCIMTGPSTVSSVQLALLFMLQFLVFTLVTISTFRLYRTRCHSELVYIVHRDGILFYVFLLILTGANLVVSLVVPIRFVFILTPSLDSLYSVFTTRIVLNIRKAATHGQTIELHSSRFGMRTNWDIQFQSASSYVTPDQDF